MGLFSGIGDFLFGKGPDTNKATNQVSQGNTNALNQLTMGVNNATSTLQPTINQGNELSNQLQDLLMGRTSTSSLPGYNAMSDTRRDSISQLGTGMAGTGKFFSGTTAEQAADIGGGLETQFLQQAIQNLMMGAQPGQNATSALANMQMGAGTAGAQIEQGSGLNLANMTMQDQSGGVFGDLLGAGSTLAGAYMGSR